MITQHVHISTGNSKLGAMIPSVNLPVGITCRKDAPCRDKCYARKGRMSMQRFTSLCERNLHIWDHDPDGYKRDILCAAAPSRFFRWHASGDIPDASYLEMMVGVAKALPKTNFLAFTKKWEMVNQFYDDNKVLPCNLTIVYSAWGTSLPENPYSLPVAHIRLRNGASSIPANAFQCQNFCGECVLGENHCWNLGFGQSVCFNEH